MTTLSNMIYKLYLIYNVSPKCFQIPNWERNLTPDEALKQFCTVIPALGLLGTPHHISPEEPYTIDDEVQLVCKYLQALKIGGTKGIDRLYKEGKCKSSMPNV